MDSLSRQHVSPLFPEHDRQPPWFPHIRDYLIAHHRGRVAEMTWTSHVASFLSSPNRSLAHLAAAPASYIGSERLRSGKIQHHFSVFLEEVSYQRETESMRTQERGMVYFPTDPKHFGHDKSPMQHMARCESIAFLRPWNTRLATPERHLETVRYQLMTRYVQHHLSVTSAELFADRETMDVAAKTRKHFGLVLRRTLSTPTLCENEAGKIVRVIVEPRMDDLEAVEGSCDL